jgi:hypothetical protein
MLLVGPARLSVMCVVGGHTARWAGSFERIPKALAVACGASDGRHTLPDLTVAKSQNPTKIMAVCSDSVAISSI